MRKRSEGVSLAISALYSFRFCARNAECLLARPFTPSSYTEVLTGIQSNASNPCLVQPPDQCRCSLSWLVPLRGVDFLAAENVEAGNRADKLERH
jgi:hypothetical protein